MGLCVRPYLGSSKCKNPYVIVDRCALTYVESFRKPRRISEDVPCSRAESGSGRAPLFQGARRRLFEGTRGPRCFRERAT